MAKKLVNRVDRNLARRLREARQETGLSTRGVASQLPRRVAVSKTMIAAYENGTVIPPIDVLAALADLYGRTLNWFLQDRAGLSGHRYRNLKSRIGVGEKRQFEAIAEKWVDAYIALERHLREPLRATVGNLTVSDSVKPAALAAAVRELLGFTKDQPIPNTITVLEAFGVHVVELRTDLSIDGMAAKRGEDFVVVLNRDTSPDRLRLNAIHELAHTLYDDCKHGLGWSDLIVEKRAYAFASEFLLPEEQLRKAFESKSFLTLIKFKEQFGISVAAMLYRAEHRKIIRSGTARRMWMAMSERGWKRREPGTVWRDRAIRFESMLDSAIQRRMLSWAEAEQVTGVRQSELQARISDAAETVASGWADAHEPEETIGHDVDEHETQTLKVMEH